MNGGRSRAGRSVGNQAPGPREPALGSAAGRLRPGDPRRYPPGLFDLGPAALSAYEKMLAMWADPKLWAAWAGPIRPDTAAAPGAADPLSNWSKAAADLAALWWSAYMSGGQASTGATDDAAWPTTPAVPYPGAVYTIDSGTLTEADIEEIAKTYDCIRVGRKVVITPLAKIKADELKIKVLKDSK